MSLVNVGAGPRTSGFVAGWRSGELHPLTTSAPATVRTRAARIRTLGNIMSALGFTAVTSLTSVASPLVQAQSGERSFSVAGMTAIGNAC